MRQGILYSSVRALLPEGERVLQIAHMWTRHRLTLAYAALAFAGFVALAFVVGVEQWSGRLGLGMAAAAVATMATTEYRVLVLTPKGLVLMNSSRVRQRAKAIIRRLPDATEVQAVGSNLVITDWSVDDQVYSVMKRHQSAMVAISQR